MKLGGGSTGAEREAAQQELNLAAATEDTDQLRRGTHPRWERLRGRLKEAGIRLEDAAIASRNTEDAALEAVLLVTKDGSAFSFEFDWLRDEQGKRLEYEDARVTEWEALDERRRSLYERELQIGREVLERESHDA